MRFKKIFFSLLILVLFAPSFVAKAADSLDLLKGAGSSAGYDAEKTDSATASQMVGNIIASVLSLLGVIFLVLIVYAGFSWLTAGGDEAKIEKAQALIKNSVIGLVIVLTSFGISRFVIGALLNASGT